MLTVILPAAGEGTRLDLPYPKELHRVVPGISLIDFSLRHIEDAAELVTNVVTVVAPGKEAVADYVAGSLDPSTTTEHVYFNSAYSEWPGSIKSAEEHFGVRNAVLLPDSVLELGPAESLMESYAAEFEAGADLVLSYVAEDDPDRLAALGALRVEGADVVAFCDKPSARTAHEYNAFWGSFAFRGEVGADVLDLMMASVAGAAVDLGSLGLSVTAFPVESYTDLGTWESISAYLSRSGSRAA